MWKDHNQKERGLLNHYNQKESFSPQDHASVILIFWLNPSLVEVSLTKLIKIKP